MLEPWYASCWPATMTTCTPGRAASMLRSSWFHAATVRASCSCAVSRAPLAGLSLPRLWPESSVVRVRVTVGSGVALGSGLELGLGSARLASSNPNPNLTLTLT